MKTGKAAANPTVYLAVGSEGWFKKKLLANLKSEFLTPGFEEMDFVFFSEPPEEDRLILEAVETVPFGSKARLVVLEGLEELKESNAGWLISMMKQAHPKIRVMVGVEKLEAAFSRRVQDWQQEGKLELVACQPLKGSALAQWVNRQAQELEKSITPEAQSMLIARVGADLRLLALSLTSLSLLAQSPQITREHVEALIRPSVRETAFDILDGAAAGEPQKAMERLHLALHQGTLTLEQFMGAIGWYYRMVWKAKMESKPMGGWSSPTRSQALKRLKQWPWSRLEKALQEVLEADAGLKRSHPAMELVADQLLFRLGG